ncbi:MAG TPA: aldehyde oxidase, partial [Candidatus Cloacimonetes bacterium]|nr:aldehyde oxidase [Candidatus Cloacimonadota bacterium]
SARFKFGIGLSCSFRGCSLGAEGTDMSSAIVSVQADGSVIVFTGVNENGQGLRTSMCQITSEILGIKLDKITFLEPQTSTISDGGPTVASRGTLVGGNAVIDAASTVKKRIFRIIKEDLKVSDIEETEWKNGKIYSRKSKDRFIEFSKAAEKSYWQGINLSAYGWFKGPKVGWDEETGQGNAYFTYVYGCQIAQIKVDTFTGKIEIEKITAAHDVGKVINRLGAEGQIYGGVTQGFGYGVLEDYNIQKGEVKSQNFDEYLIPTTKEIPEIDPILIENPDKFGPFGAKSIGEPTLELTSAAINNALKFAVGKHSYQIPLTLEQVYLGKNLRKPARQSEVFHHSKMKTKQVLRTNNIKTITPKNLENALEILSGKKFQILAGGTDIIVQARMKTELQNLLNIYSLQELKEITETENEIIIGSAVTFSKLISNKIIQKHFPILVKACSSIGSTQIRNRATIGGNIINAAPCADSVPPLILRSAELVLQSKSENRKIPIKDFIIKHYKTQIKTDEILISISIPKPSNKKYYHSYSQLGRRNAMNITRMSISAMISFASNKNIEECYLVDGSLFSCSQRLTNVENFLIGKPLNEQTIEAIEKPLSEKIEKEIGNRWSSEYKKPVFINMCKDALREIAADFHG